MIADTVKARLVLGDPSAYHAARPQSASEAMMGEITDKAHRQEHIFAGAEESLDLVSRRLVFTELTRGEDCGQRTPDRVPKLVRLGLSS